MKLRRASHTLGALAAPALFVLLALAAPAPPARAQEAPPREVTTPAKADDKTEAGAESPPVAFGTLDEIRGKRLVRLLVVRPRTVSASDPTQGVVAAVASGADTSPRLRWTHDLIARRLNKYIRKYRSMTAILPGMEPDYVIVFHLLRYRAVLNGVYPSGDMYVVSYKAPGPARILWRTSKEMFEEDATKELLKALKASRGEK
jgi:hypothetical protein